MGTVTEKIFLDKIYSSIVWNLRDRQDKHLSLLISGVLGTVGFPLLKENIDVLTTSPSMLELRSLKSSVLNSIYSWLINSFFGVSFGYHMEITIKGIGYRFKFKSLRFKRKMKGLKKRGRVKRKRALYLTLGYSHRLLLPVPLDIIIRYIKLRKVLVIYGLSKERVFEFANKLRLLKPMNIYTGKGIRFTQAVVRLKPGKQR